MAHHYALTLGGLAKKIRTLCFSKNTCPSIIGQQQLFTHNVPLLAASYSRKSELDWINYICDNNKIRNGYEKVQLPFTTNNDKFDMNLISWLPGSTTRVHSHPKYRIMISTVIYGKLEETLFITKYDKDLQNNVISNIYKHSIYTHESSYLEDDSKHVIHNPLDVTTYSLQISLLNDNNIMSHCCNTNITDPKRCGNDGYLCANHDEYVSNINNMG